MYHNHKRQHMITEILEPHTYPLWIKFGFLLTISLFFASLTKINQYNVIHQKIHKTTQAFKTRNFNQAIKKYKKLVSQFPRNKKFKIQLAKTFFSSNNEINYYQAMNLLVDVSLDYSEWKELSPYIPEEYLEYFIDKE